MVTLASGEIVQFDNFRLDQRGGGLFRKDEHGSFVPVAIGSRALELLVVLIARAGELVSRQEIMDAVWPGTAVEESNLTVQLAALRRVLDAERPDGSCIRTVPGRGYRFIATVTHLEPVAQPPPGEEASRGSGVIAEAAASTRRNHALRGGAILLLIGLAATGLAVFRPETYGWFRDQTSPPTLSIVVLPFANLSSDPEQEYFADAITDDLTTDLTRIEGSVVIAHSTAQSYRGKAMDVRQIGHDLGVRYVLEGSVRRIGDQVEVNAQLVDSKSGAHVWADRFETDRRDLAEAQSGIIGRLARTLHLQMVEAAGRLIEQEKRRDPDASDLVMRGWLLWFRPLSAASHEEAARAFERALKIDPRSVDAKIGVATILISNVGTGLSHAPEQDSARAEQLLTEAIEQESNSSAAYEALGTLRRIQNRLDESRIELEQAVALDHNNAHALLQLGETLMFLGHPADAIPVIDASVRLNPRESNAAFSDWALGTCHLLLGHTDEAADLLLKARAENPRVYYFQIYLAGALGLRGDIDEARSALAEAIRLKPQADSLARWAAVQPWIGNRPLMVLRENTLDVGLRRAGMPDH
jgi:adenylate cyclase